MLGYPRDRNPFYRLPIVPPVATPTKPGPVVIAPGCKTGEMEAKRWPYYPQLAEKFAEVIVVGTADDLKSLNGATGEFPRQAQLLAGKLTLKETAEVMAAAALVIGNDSGLCHVAAALGTPTIMIFGPTPHRTLGQFPPNVLVLSKSYPCQPCWFTARLHACQGRVDCLSDFKVEEVEHAARFILGSGQPPARVPNMTICLEKSLP
ncbi:MAG: glycosyltransferase family 9 protein [Acidobacteriota bacterium]|nr:glycosyltransferase family 9 protein [Acidobacteriota bacterium]